MKKTYSIVILIIFIVVIYFFAQYLLREKIYLVKKKEVGANKIYGIKTKNMFDYTLTYQNQKLKINCTTQMILLNSLKDTDNLFNNLVNSFNESKFIVSENFISIKNWKGDKFILSGPETKNPISTALLLKEKNSILFISCPLSISENKTIEVGKWVIENLI
jgi:uncharacterized membrane protein YvbJ